ncbi:Hypothetical predicted protein [Octopus vulgaris]|uniref:Uncharacterized protein n=1 Tax=Octopus vulgaris TaxID=6645 RepID=A0AA36EZA7_OCTVU|nr:Hypothetical predicted protein [Octopus vulgaris]
MKEEEEEEKEERGGEEEKEEKREEEEGGKEEGREGGGGLQIENKNVTAFEELELAYRERILSKTFDFKPETGS